MYQCDNCGREFRGKSGLTNHSKVCEPIVEVVEEEQPIIEEVVSNEVVSEQELSDNIVRKIEKLKSARASTWDAEARHNIDMQIAELMK